MALFDETLSVNLLDRCKLKTKFDIQYSWSVVHLLEMFSIFVRVEQSTNILMKVFSQSF